MSKRQNSKRLAQIRALPVAVEGAVAFPYGGGTVYLPTSPSVTTAEVQQTLDSIFYGEDGCGMEPEVYDWIMSMPEAEAEAIVAAHLRGQ